MYLDEMIDGSLLSEMIDQGYVKVQHHPDDRRYRILNYTEKAVFDKVWNEVTRQCRGLIIFNAAENTRAVVLARPFAKFFNYGEAEATKIRLDEMVSVFDKVDGSLGIMYTAPDGLPAIATRGSFASPQAQHATEVLRKRHPNYRAPEGLTPIFEIVYPENRIVLDYHGLDDLILLGYVDVESGSVRQPSPFVDREFASAQYFGTMPMSSALKMTHRKNAEGLVVRSTESGGMVKIKQEDYLALHKIIFGLTERAVWEQLKAGKRAGDICAGLPDEFHPWVKDVSSTLLDEFQHVLEEVNDRYVSIIRWDPAMSRKDFALEAQKSPYPGLLFLLLDSQYERLEEKVWDLIRPEHRPYAANLAA